MARDLRLACCGGIRVSGMDAESDRAVPSREAVDSWVAAYVEAWRSEGTAALAEFFVEDAVYRMSPYAEPVRGLAAIAELWERERTGPDEEFELRHEIVAVDGHTAVVRVEVEYGTGAEYRDLWIVGLDADGRCRRFEEWPFWPGQPIADERSESR
jgi:ketosteroid isomerase-like protein